MVEIIKLDYPQNLGALYQKYADLPGFVLLHSADHQRGRYDILSAYPYRRLRIDEQENDRVRIIADVKEQLPTSPAYGNLPFQGGAIGYISYDFGERLYGITAAKHSRLSIPLINLAFYDWALIADHQLQQLTLFAAHQRVETAEIVKEICSLFNEKQAEAEDFFKVTSQFNPLMQVEEYQQAFANIQQALRAGRCYQVNLTQPFIAAYEGDTWSMYQHIIKRNPVPFAAFLRDEATTVLSFSPERFLLSDQGELLTSPIKGTSPRGKTSEDDLALQQELQRSAKNRAENVMIVDLLRNDLSQISTAGSVEVTALCEVQSFSKVHHLVSTIKAQALPELHPFDLFLACFPGGSITGAPKREAMRVIQEQEAFRRGIYCGAIGYFSQHGRFDTNIAIRTMIAQDKELYLSAGGGIVIDSACDDEYRECFTKIEAILNGLC